jgi:hypothetical protein
MKNWKIDYKWKFEGSFPFSMERYLYVCMNDKKTSKKELIEIIFDVLERNDLLKEEDLKKMFGEDFDNELKIERNLK